jgi:hypothetical protein
MERRYWFRAKRYGYGWGLPLTWEGWAVLLAWSAVVVVGSAMLAGFGRWWAFALFCIVMMAIIAAICRATGEPPRWRWAGQETRPSRDHDDDGA